MTRPLRRIAAPPPTHDLNPRPDPVLDFPDRDLGELTADDYARLGFLCGLEVHQQLLTRRKLFCRCPAGRRAARADAAVLRHMRPTLSEMGLYDGCALMEFKTRKEILYRLGRGTVCTYEIDDTPPFPIDEEAVRIALEISRLFDLDLVSELQVMRKQYLDGSIPTGFQRTAMIGIRGTIPFRASELGAERQLRIRQLTLEEDSCREESDEGHRITFWTDRLGMPLIETVTEPDLLTPRDVEAGGRLLAAVARSSGKVRRGPGAARQDVNVSIAGGRRVEIKGVDRLRGLPRLVHTEAFRQLNLLRIRAELRRRGVTAERLAVPAEAGVLDGPLAADVSSIARNCLLHPMAGALDTGGIVAAVRLADFGGMLRHGTQPGVAFADELSERVRVIACLTARPFLTHSDATDSGLASSPWKEIRRAVRAEPSDAIVVVWGPRGDVETACLEVLARAGEALSGVPSETRQARADGTTGFERILPGAERMYPDTDTPPLPIPDAWIEAIEASLPERPWQRIDRARALGLSTPAAASLAEAPWSGLFDELAPRKPETARRLAEALRKRLVHAWRRRGSRELPCAERIRPLVEALDAGRVRAEGFEMLFDRILEAGDGADGNPKGGGGATPARGIVDACVVAKDPSRTIPDWVDRPEKLHPPRPPASRAAWIRWAMGQVMPDLRGRVDPALVRRRIAKTIGASPPAGKVSP